jgi:hypothetical protein
MSGPPRLDREWLPSEVLDEVTDVSGDGPFRVAASASACDPPRGGAREARMPVADDVGSRCDSAKLEADASGKGRETTPGMLIPSRDEEEPVWDDRAVSNPGTRPAVMNGNSGKSKELLPTPTTPP